MNTSYYSKSKDNPNAVSIARMSPHWYSGREYKELAPKEWFLRAYKDGELSEKEYTECYYEEVLKELNAKKVYADLGEDAVMLCWESSEKFCHRHIVAEWLSKELGIEINEL